MDARALAKHLEWSIRTARRYLEHWAGLQSRPDVPRVVRVSSDRGKGGRPHYEVDQESVDQWFVTAHQQAA